MLNRREMLEASIPMAAPLFPDKNKKPEKIADPEEKKPTNFLRVWKFGDKVTCTEENVEGLVKIIGELKKRAEDKGGDQDIAVGGDISCQVIPYGSGFDAVLALTENAKESCVFIIK
jgi:hypothetical protein